MTTTPPEAPAGTGPQDGPPPGPRASRDQVRDLARLRRSSSEKKIAGVAGGLARHFDVDPLVVRVVLVVLAFFGGAGLLLYGACWLLVPPDDGTEAPVALDDRTRPVALVVVGVLAAAALLSDSWGFIRVPWPLVLIGAAALYLFTRRSNRSTVPPPGAYGPGPGPAYGPDYGPTYGPAHGPAYGPAYGLHHGPAHGPVPPGAVSHTPHHPGGPGSPGLGHHVATAPLPVQTWSPPSNPRRRGPLLFWFTAALATLGLGVLGLLDAGGMPVAASAYPALVVAVCGAMLVVGAFYGRAGGLAAVGILAVVPMALVSAGERWEGTRLAESPSSGAAVSDRYEIDTGELLLDLGGISAAELDGRRIELDADIGLVEVVVPAGMDVQVDARVHGPGGSNVFGTERGGLDHEVHASFDGGVGVPTLVIDAELTMGEIIVRTADGRTR